MVQRVTRILFVCTGNICRSPTADGIARAKAAARGVSAQFAFDSAGLENYHVGEPPDRRAVAQAGARGYDLSNLRARRITQNDFKDFDLILAMDRGHVAELDQMCPRDLRRKVKLFLSYSDRYPNLDVPDPYYGAVKDFDRVLDMCEDGVEEILSALSVP